LKNLNEEDYLESLLKSMDNNTEESNEETSKESDKLSSLDELVVSDEVVASDELVVPDEVATSENLVVSDEVVASDDLVVSDEVEVSDDLAVSEELDDISMSVADKIGKASTGVISDENNRMNELSEDYNELFEPEDRDFKISDIPDREPAELTQSELDRLADMNSNEMDDTANESVSVNQFLDKKDNNSKDNSNENDLNENDIKNKSSNNINSTDKLGDSILDIDSFEADAIAAAAKAISGGVISAAEDIIPNIKIKKQKKDKVKSDKSESDKLKSGKKKTVKKNSILKFIRNIFFEDLEHTEKVEQEIQGSIEKNDEPRDENQRVLDELYGNDGQKEFVNDSDYKGDNDFKGDSAFKDNNNDNSNDEPIKKGFFARKKAKAAAKKAQLSELMKAEEDAEELELNKKKAAKAEKKLAAKVKKEEAKAKKEESKKPKEEKVKKPKKEKKPKEPTRPQDMLKIKPMSLILLVSFVAGMVVLIEIGNTAFYYNNDVNQAKLYFQNENYQKAFDSLQGVTLKPADEELYNQINTIMFVQKQYTSYQNYVKLGMGVEALDSLIKGVQRYYEYYPTAKDLGVAEQLDANKALIDSALKTTFSMSEEKAISYASLSDIDFTQYYLTLESYGGMVTK